MHHGLPNLITGEGCIAPHNLPEATDKNISVTAAPSVAGLRSSRTITPRATRVGGANAAPVAGGKVTPARRPATFGVPRNELRFRLESLLFVFLNLFGGRFRVVARRFRSCLGTLRYGLFVFAVCMAGKEWPPPVFSTTRLLIAQNTAT